MAPTSATATAAFAATPTDEDTLKFLQALADGDPDAQSEFYDDRAAFEATFGEYDREGIG